MGEEIKAWKAICRASVGAYDEYYKDCDTRDTNKQRLVQVIK